MNKAGAYIGDMVYGANDGIITTFAVVSGVAGATLSPNIVVILGVANLIADGFSMAASNYLARRSEEDYQISLAGPLAVGNPVNNAVITFISFVVAGVIPLLPYILGVREQAFTYSILATSATLFTVGSLRTLVTRASWYRSGFEMLFVGSLAATVAYFIGYLLGNLA